MANETSTGSATVPAGGQRADRGEPVFFGQKMTTRQKMTRRIVRLLMLLGVLASVGVGVQAWLASATASTAPAETNAKTLPVTTTVAQRVTSYARERSYTGILREAKRSRLSFQRGGELLELRVDEGQAIEAGQVLGRLDARHIRAQRAQIEAQVAEAKAVLDELLAGPRPETIAAKRAELRAQQSQQQVLAGQLERRKQLLQTSSVSREEYETFLYDYEAAIARVDVIQRQLDEMLAGTREQQIAAQRARLAQLDAQLTDLAHDLDDTQLVAPFSGRVARRYVDEGTVITAGTPVLEIIDDTHLEAWVGLPPSAAMTLDVGQPRQLAVGSNTIDATIQSLAPDVQQTTRTRNVILRLQSQSQPVFPGQVVRLAVTEQVAEAGYWVPTTALTRGTRGLWSVYVVVDDVVARRDVELLDTVGNESFVRGTLRDGDAIVASGAHRVVVGQRVTAQAAEVAQR